MLNATIAPADILRVMSCPECGHARLAAAGE